MFPEVPESHINPPHSQLTDVFDWMPVCAIVCDSYGLIQQINKQAVDFFRADTKEDFIFDKQQLAAHVLDQSRIKELIKQAGKKNENIYSKLFFRLFDKSVTGTEVRICRIPEKKEEFLILFFENKIQSELYIQELSRAFRNEALRLKPYLNKPGKDLLDEITNSESTSTLTTKKNSTKLLSQLVGEERLHRISEKYPYLSEKELNLCGYLSLHMSIEDVASITGNTPNALRVLFHRIFKKTPFETSREFLISLENIDL